MPEVVEDFRKTPIALDRKEPFFVYLSYGDPSSSTILENITLRTTLSSSALSFATNNLYEIVRNNPQSTGCSEGTEGEARLIRSDLVQDRVFNYGPYSAANPDAPSGEKNASLSAKQTGCLKIGLKVGAKAEANDSAQLIFEQLEMKNNELKQITNLPVKTIYFSLATLKSCAATEEFIGGQCLTACKYTEYRALDSTCKPKLVQCDHGQEAVKDSCVDICPAGTTRNTFGECRKVERSWNDMFSQVVMVLLSLTVLLAFSMLIANIIKQLKRIK